MQQGFGDLRKFRSVFHAVRHIGAVEVRAQAHVIDAGNFHGVVDVFDDFAEFHTREFALFDVLAGDAVALDKLAAFVLRAPFHDLGADGLVQFRIGFFRVAEFLAEKAHVVIDLHDAAFRGEILHHLVGHVAGRIANGAAGRVRGKERSFAGFQSVVKCFIAHVGDVHHNSEAVHFADHVLAEIREAIVHGLVRGRIRPFVIAAVGKRHVPDAQSREAAQHTQIAVDHVAALDSEECCNLSLFVGVADFGRSRRQNEIVRMLANLLAHRVDLNQCTVNGLRPGNFAGHPDGKENRPKIPFPHAGNIDAPGGAARTKVELSIKKSLRRVVVRVHDDRGEVQLARFFRNGIGGHGKNRKTHSGNPHNG